MANTGTAWTLAVRSQGAKMPEGALVQRIEEALRSCFQDARVVQRSRCFRNRRHAVEFLVRVTERHGVAASAGSALTVLRESKGLGVYTTFAWTPPNPLKQVPRESVSCTCRVCGDKQLESARAFKAYPQPRCTRCGGGLDVAPEHRSRLSRAYLPKSLTTNS